MSLSLWQQCLARLQDELPATEFSMWIRPLQAELSDNTLALYAPNRFVLDRNNDPPHGNATDLPGNARTTKVSHGTNPQHPDGRKTNPPK